MGGDDSGEVVWYKKVVMNKLGRKERFQMGIIIIVMRIQIAMMENK